MINLSKRLQAVANLVSTGGRIVDIGTDHAYIPLYLVQNGIKQSAVAADVNKGPLAIAKEHIERNNLSASITTVLSDGLKNVDILENDSIVIAGMGGLLTLRIMKDSMEKIKLAKEVIIQPQSELGELRRFLDAAGIKMTDETAVIDEGKYYFPMRLDCRQASMLQEGNSFSADSDSEDSQGQKVLEELASEVKYLYGAGLLEKADSVLKEYLEKQKKINSAIISELEKRPATEELDKRISELKRIEDGLIYALDYYYGGK